MDYNTDREPLRITKLRCHNCGHVWKPRVEYLPVTCPYCKSKNWRTDRIINEYQQKLDGGGG